MNDLFWQYVDTLQTGQRQILEAQVDCFRTVCQSPFAVLGPVADAKQVEPPLLSGAAVFRASADVQHDLFLLTEKWLGSQQRGWLEKTKAISPAVTTPYQDYLSHVDLGFSGCLIASRAARQIHHFALTRFSYATLTAVRGAHSAVRKVARHS